MWRSALRLQQLQVQILAPEIAPAPDDLITRPVDSRRGAFLFASGTFHTTCLWPRDGHTTKGR